MRRAQGIVVVADPERPTYEADTTTCGHCQRIVVTKAGTAATVYLVPTRLGQWREEPGAFCRVCMRAVCLVCHGHGQCYPWEERLRRMEERATRIRQGRDHA